MKRTWLSSVAFAALFVGASGCVVETAPAPDPAPASAPNPVTLATVDAGIVLTSPPGLGAGVFVEYQEGGHWHLWWTCDTQASGLPCTFHVDATVATGAITNVAGDRLESNDSLGSPAPNEVSLQTVTTSGVDGVFFDTAPGATINVLQQIGDTQDGSFFFWSQNGEAVGGGSTPGGVDDPLNFVGSSP